MGARVILALAPEAAEANDLIWSRLKIVQDEMFSGPISRFGLHIWP